MWIECGHIASNRSRWISASTLLDSGATCGLVDRSWCMRNNLKTYVDNEIRVKAFNNSVTRLNQFVKVNLYDNERCLIGHNKFALMDGLGINLLVGIDFITKYQLQIAFHTEDIVLKSPKSEFRLVRVLPRKIECCNTVLYPGPNKIEMSRSWLNFESILSINIEHEHLRMYEQYFEPKSKKTQVTIVNNSKDFVDLEDINECFEFTEVKPVENLQPFYYRKTLNLVKLDTSKIVIGNQASSNFRKQVLGLINKYNHIFSRSDDDIGRYRGNMSYKIELSNPIKDTYSKVRYSKPDIEFIELELEKLLKYEIIERCPENSRIYCGLVISTKKLESGKVKKRLCLASNIVNKETRVVDNYPLPEIPELLQKLSGRNIYTQLDLNCAFWQIDLPIEQRYLYTFEFKGIVYQFTRSSFGTRGMPHFYSALMFSLVGDIDGVVIYLDDVTLASRNHKEHLMKLEQIFEVFSKRNMTLSLNKCSFAQETITSFGYVVNRHGYKPCKNRIEKLLKLECPKTVKEVQKRIGALNYYCHAVANFKLYAEPFYNLKKNFEYTSELENQWKALLDTVSKCFLKIDPDFSKPLRIVTDSSALGGGVVMSQERNGSWYPVLIDSFIYKGRVRLARISYKEFSVVYRTFKQHKRFILCFPKIELLCDNKVTVLLLNKIFTVEILKRSAPCSWLMFLSHFEFEVKHISGVSNEMLLSDLLSRSNIDFSELEPRFTLGELKSQECVEIDHYVALTKVDDVLKVAKNFDYEQLRNLVKVKQVETGFDSSEKTDLHRLEKIRMNTNREIEYKIVYNKAGKLRVPNEFIKDLLVMTHIHGPPTIWYRMIQKLDISIYGLQAKLASYYNSCSLCASINKKRENNPKTSVMATSQIGELYHIDVVHINRVKCLMAIDHFSSYIIMSVIPDEKETSICNGLYEIFFSLLIPNQILTDNAASFRSKKVEELMDTLNIHHRFITPRWSPANGKIERSFRSIRNILKVFNFDSIDINIAIRYAVFIMNNKRTKKSDFTPFEILSFRSSVFPFNMPYFSLSRLDNSSPATRKFVQVAQDIMADIRNKKLADLEGLTDMESVKLYQKGDIVLIKAYPVKNLSSKLLAYYDQTEFEIVEVVRRAKTYVIQKIQTDTRLQNQRFRIAHSLVKRIRKAKEDSELELESPEIETSDSETANDSDENSPEEPDLRGDGNGQAEADQVQVEREEPLTQLDNVRRKRRGSYNLRSLK